MKTNGQDLVKMKRPMGVSFRNMFIWDDRIFYTNQKNDTARGFVQNGRFMDGPLILYSTAMDGSSDMKKEIGFDARVTFDVFSHRGEFPVEAGGENRSVSFDCITSTKKVS